MVQEKIGATTREIREIEDNIQKLREKIETNQGDYMEAVEEPPVPRKDFACQVMKLSLIHI